MLLQWFGTEYCWMDSYKKKKYNSKSNLTGSDDVYNICNIAII